MYGNESLSKSGCKNQVNNWRCGYNISNQVLIKIFTFCSIFIGALSLAGLSNAESANTEAAYYTWVDAQGNVHSSLIPTQKKSNEIISVQDIAEPQSTIRSKNQIDKTEYLTEEKHQEKLKKDLEDKKPFFTWTDGQGIIRSELKPDVLVDFVAEEIVYDAVLAPPFRLPDYVMQGSCCVNYSEAFTSIAKFNGSASYQVDDTLFPFQTQSGEVPAGYFSLPDLSPREIVLLKGYKLPLDSSVEIVALDASYRPLYLVSELKGVSIEQTWKDIAYKKILLEISDPEVNYLIVFVQLKGKLAIPKGLKNYRLSLMRDQLAD